MFLLKTTELQKKTNNKHKKINTTITKNVKKGIKTKTMEKHMKEEINFRQNK